MSFVPILDSVGTGLDVIVVFVDKGFEEVALDTGPDFLDVTP